MTSNSKLRTRFSTSASIKDVTTPWLNVVYVGDFGLGSVGPSLLLNDADMLKWLGSAGSGFYRNNITTAHNMSYSAGVLARSADTWAYFSVHYNGGGVRVAAGGPNVNYVYELWTSRNTTVDTNGAIRKASPIVKLVDDATKMDDTFTADGQFVVSGCAAVNNEADGVSAEKVSTGVYRVTGALGLAKEGWTIEGPKDHNDNRLCFIETETAESGVITVRVSSRRFDVSSAKVVAGTPMNIPCGR